MKADELEVILDRLTEAGGHKQRADKLAAGVRSIVTLAKPPKNGGHLDQILTSTIFGRDLDPPPLPRGADGEALNAWFVRRLEALL